MNRQKFAVFICAILVCIGNGVAAARGQVALTDRNTGNSAAVDVLLDGPDWRMGSFDFGEGVAAGAAAVEFNDGAFHAVTVPGDTQLQAGFTGVAGFRESKGLMAVNGREWWYRKQFHAAQKVPGMLSRIVFDGSDYFTTVWLNGHQLGTHEGTYVGFSFDVTALLNYGGDNVLSVLVTHPWVPKDRAVDEYMDGDFSMALGTPLAGLPYHVGINWDGLPAQGNAAIPMGIWRSVHLRTSGPMTIDDLHVVTRSIEPDGSASLHIQATVGNASQKTETCKIELTLAPDNFAGTSQEIPALTIRALPGETTAEEDVRVKNAKLWWSWDKGPQNLYHLKASFDSANGLPGDERVARFGIRTVARDADMAYHVNGQKQFIKASWFPIENFYRSTPTREDYERDLRLFRNANYNLLVNFTVVEKPEFYDLCDELGILVVAEMPFPQFGPQHVLDKDSPRREPFLKQARLQVTQIITAERNHPSIIQYTPLAEAHDKDKNEWGSFGPGGYYATDQQGYETFVSEMKDLVTTLAPDSVFHASLCDLGEQHFWIGGDWDPRHYQEQFDAKAGFISEYGTTSMSSYDNLGKYLTPEEQWGTKDKTANWFNLPIDANAYAYWTANMNIGLSRMIDRSMRFVDRDPRSAQELVEDTQLYQAFLMKFTAEAYRRKKYEPINGIRNWDFLELAPGFRFAIVDYDRVPKTAYWYMKRAQAPVAISFAYKEALESQLAGTRWSAPVWVINDLDREIRGTVHAELLTLGGDRVAAEDYPVVVRADDKAIAGTFSLTLPQAAGVYVLRATLPPEVAGGNPVEEISYIKVVPAAFEGSHRVLLIAQSKFAEPIAALLRSMGVGVDIFDENSLSAMSRDLIDGAAIHARYDAIWVGSFEFLGKMLPNETAKAVQEAVKAGSGFIVTGGEGSFHGGDGHAALIEGTDLAAILPVEPIEREDVRPGPYQMNDALPSRSLITDITRVGNDDVSSFGISAESLELLRRYGLVAFNQVSVRPGARMQLAINEQPLLVTGAYGAGKTAAFTGFTPEESDSTKLPFDQYLMGEPALRAYFDLTQDLLADVLPGNQKIAPGLLDSHEKPLFQTLKEQPETALLVTKIGSPQSDEGAKRFAVRIENHGSYAHLVHLKSESNGTGARPYLVEFSDNDFEMLPKESKEIELELRTGNPDQSMTWTLTVSAANAHEATLAF